MTLRIHPDYESAAAQELSRWPGTSISFQAGGNHPVAVLSFGTKTYKVFFPGSPSDSRRGAMNFTKDLRRGLRALGAQMRLPLPAPSVRPQEARQKPPRSRPRLPRKPPEPVRQDKWHSALQALSEKMLAND